MKKEKRIIAKNKFSCIAGILCCFLLLLIFIELKNVKNSIYDTFYAEDVYFQIENHNLPSYRITFQLFSSQGKSYKKNELLVKFKCYDKNGFMIADDVEAKIEKGKFEQGIMTYVSNCRTKYEEIKYCELNYVQIN